MSQGDRQLEILIVVWEARVGQVLFQACLICQFDGLK